MKNTNIRTFLVHTRSPDNQSGLLQSGNRLYPCMLGRSGLSALKREGDGATPIGQWSALHVYYRADRVARPQTLLPLKTIRKKSGWCDDPANRNYNRLVPLPYEASAETLWRDDHLYDLIVVLDYNINQRSRGKGSAIFMHLMNPDKKPTEGCIALTERDLREVLKKIGRWARIKVSG